MPRPEGTEAVEQDIEHNEAVEKGHVEPITGQLVAEIDEATERRVRRKFDRVLLSLTFAAYLCAFLDRSNVGNAETAGMGEDLGFGDSHYQVKYLLSPLGGGTLLTT